MGHNLTWNFGRQLASFDEITYTYDENGIRTSKTVNGVATKYYLDGTKIFMQYSNELDSMVFYYDRNDEAVGFRYKGSTYYYVKNLQGDVIAIITDEGFLAAEYTYDDWGKVLSVTGWQDVANANPFRYRGYYYDTETGLYYLQSRYYDPEVGRFINCDDVNYIGVSDTVVSYNSFAYCENNPVNYIDPYGNRVYAVGFQLDLYAIYGASISVQFVWDSNGDVGVLVFASFGVGWSASISAVFKLTSKYQNIFQLRGITTSISGCISYKFISAGVTYAADDNNQSTWYVTVGFTVPSSIPVGGSCSYGSSTLIYLFNYKKYNKKKLWQTLKSIMKMHIRINGRQYRASKR